MQKSFGPLLRSLREEQGFGLREFAALINEKPSNLSVIENENRRPWMDPNKLELVADALGLKRDSRAWIDFFSAARRDGDFPADVQSMGNRELVPSLLRTINRAQLTDAELEDLIAHIEREHGLSTKHQ